MRQVKLIPAGCQLWNSGLVQSGGNRFAFCSTLAIYVYNLKSFQLERIISAHERTITGLTWCPHNPDLIATCSIENTVRVWNIATQEEITTFQTSQREDVHPNCIDWSPHDEDLIATASQTGFVRVWHLSSGRCDIIKGENNSSMVYPYQTKHRVIRWSPNLRGRLACGQGDCSVYIIDYGVKKSVKRIVCKSGAQKEKEGEDMLMDLQWDPLSNYYLLLGFKKGTIILYDTERFQDLMTFDRVGGALRSLAWNTATPGGFVSVDERAGVMRLWNVSQKTPREVVKIGKTGFQNFHFIGGGGDHAACSFKDGLVGVYDLTRKVWDFKTEVGHTETVFDCVFKPNNPDIMATGSYDGTIKIWDMSTLTCVTELFGHQGIIYSLSWAPMGDDRLIAASSQAELFVWDTKRSQPLKKLQFHSRPIFSVAWHPSDINLIASSSADGLVVLARPSGEMLRKYKHPCSQFGLSWNPVNRNLLAVGGQDALVRCYDVSVGTDTPKYVLKGHKSKVFSVAWSPLLPNLLMTGSDDMDIRVWDVSKPGGIGPNGPVVLRGHTSNVRALSWCAEIPFLVLSGSWDSTIRVWDLRDGSCRQVLYDHHADVYALASHPHRPFVYVSVSRDMSLRVWTLEDHVSVVKLRMLLDRPWADICGTPEENMEVTDLNIKLSSSYAKDELCHLVTSSRNEIEKMRTVINYFSPPMGTRELWELVDSSVNNIPCSKFSRVQHMRDIVSLKESEAQQLETKAFGRGTQAGTSRRNDPLVQAAKIYMQLGQIEKYCSVLVELGEWEKAIAAAPAVSINFWKELTKRYADHLYDQENVDCVPYYASIGRSDRVCDMYNSRNEDQEAFLCARVASEGGYPHPGGDGGGLHEASFKVDCEEERFSGLAHKMAEKHYVRADPVMAACCHLAINDSDRAVQKLMKGNQVELAAAISRALRVPQVDHVYEALALRCEALGAIDLAIDVLQYHRQPRVMVDLLCARVQGMGRDVDYLFAEAGLSHPDSYLRTAEEKEMQGNISEAIRCYLLAGQQSKAVQLGLDRVKAALMEPYWDANAVFRMMKPLHSVRMDNLESHEREELLAYMALIGGYMALYKGYAPVIGILFGTCRKLVMKCGLHDFPVPIYTIQLQYASFLITRDQRRTEKLLDELISMQDVPSNVLEHAHDLLGRINHNDTSMVQRDISTETAMVVTAQDLPTGVDIRAPRISIVTKKVVQGPEFTLEDGESVMTLSEALMWAKCNPYSPLCSGSHINPF